ncbi:MFS transporter [Acidaminobacter hydrogenoformans]|uniref:MFS transporter, DHA3 family, macrolide efflux protein n=1 Tax=Acidaminobacter hydrogenoformans DSM 2784 TaxID=1120920 RepID=A0A1G5S8F5_9FIRM|nr:MFS transporter [Acidaminobacter hydrogenoformans]SCZ81879.1 MFS transporter, DHA3 family, macrolide efflux protein [Acidaminobacter hydrogenoformans DSM 2784]
MTNEHNHPKAWIRETVVFMTSQMFTLFGSSLVQYAILWYITLETKSGLMVTISAISGFLPAFILSPFAGVWADRYDRKKMIILSDIGIALATLILAFFLMAGFKALWLMFVLSAVRSIGSGVQMPAVNALLPQLVPKEKLTRVNGINYSLQSGLMLASPVASGALMSMTSLQNILFIDIVTAVIAVGIMILFLHVRPHEKALSKQEGGYFEDLKLGFSYIGGHAFILHFFVFFGITMFLVSPSAFLTPLQVTRTFNGTYWHLTVIEVVFFVGMLAGGGLMAAWGGLKNRIHTIALAGVLIGVGTLALGIVPSFWGYTLFLGLIGVSIPMYNTPSTVLIQETVDENYMGRVFGVMSMLSSAMMPLGMMFFGPVSDKVAIEWLMIATGVLIVFLSAGMILDGTLVAAGREKVTAALEPQMEHPEATEPDFESGPDDRL